MEEGSNTRIINRISKDVSSRICTAQVVTSASGAIRQLVDNAIDAGATTIDIRIIDHGYTSLEVGDDGSGIEPANFDSICKPHATSKLTDFSDFKELTTLGFRGEALNALCALGSLSILTRSEESLLGTKLSFDHKGNIVEKTNTAKPIGTTVTVERLFETLPVRRKEFEKTQKKEFGRIIATVQCFCLSRPDVKFVLTNTVAGKKQQILCTSGKVGLKEVVGNLFGGRTDKNKMLDLVRSLPDDEICSLYGLIDVKDEEYELIKLSGYISSCEHGYGRSSADRQFLYFNKRPVDYPKVCRAINEVYQQYNKSQYPTLVLFVDVPPESIDVNVTPDKRTVFYEKERVLIALIRATISTTLKQVLGVFSSSTSSLASQSLISRSHVSLNTSNVSDSSFTNGPLPSVFDLLKSASFNSSRRSSTLEEPSAKRSRTIRESTHKTLEAFAFNVVSNKDTRLSAPSNKINTTEKITDVETTEKVAEAMQPTITSIAEGTKIQLHVTPLKEKRKSDASLASSKKKNPCSSSKKKNESANDLSGKGTASKDLREIFQPINDRNIFSDRTTLSSLSRRFDKERAGEDDLIFKALEKRLATEENFESNDEPRINGNNEDVPLKEPKNEIFSQLPPPTVSSQLDSNGTFMRPQQTVPFSRTAFEARIQKLEAENKTKLEVASQLNSTAVFEAGLEPECNEKAEKELTQILQKSDFNNMQILGQFNKGFIIARLKNNLFIIDQHASDEKYNYERFQKKACVENQKLLKPSPLNFGALQECCLKDNIDIFRANGFDFEFKTQEDGSSAAYLSSVPVLNSWQFDRGDIEEILSFVQEFPGEMYRPSKLQKIFASRACRKSVMIGTSLNRKQMETIVQNLSKLDQPWNCPHGRPTLRHLKDISCYSDLQDA